MQKNNDVDEGVEENFIWASRWQHVLYAIAYISNFNALFDVFMESRHKNCAYIFQLIILGIVIGYPILMFQTCAGQYTRNGYLFLGEMFPLFYGLGFSMLVVAFDDMLRQYYYFKRIFQYLMSCIFNTELPWMKCFAVFSERYPNCISKHELDNCRFRANMSEPCFAPGSRYSSAQIFKDEIAFPSSNQIEIPWFIPTKLIIVSNLLVGFLVALLVTISTNKNFRTIYPAFRIGYSFCLMLTFFLSILFCTQDGIFLGLSELLHQIIHPQLIQLNTWLIIMRKVVITLKLAEGGHFLFGSFVSPNILDRYRLAFLILAYDVTCFGCVLYFYINIGPLETLIGMRTQDFVEEKGSNYIYVLFPTILGIVHYPNFFSSLFFLMFFLISYFGIVVKILVIETTITTYFRISGYAAYVRFFIYVMTGFCCFLLEFDVVTAGFFNISTLREVAALIIVVLQLIALFTYGLRNFTDDIEYMTKTKVKPVVKISWVLAAVLCLVTTASDAGLVDFTEAMLPKLFYVIAISLPLAGGFFYKLIDSFRKDDLMGILKPTEQYGPPDVEQRIMRILYNPRYIIKSKRRVEFCDHTCLQGCNAIKTAVKLEIGLHKVIQDSISNRTLEQEIEESNKDLFKKHLELLFVLAKKFSKSTN